MSRCLSTRRLFGFGLLASCLLPVANRADEPPLPNPPDQTVVTPAMVDLVRKLGDESYRERCLAEQELTALGSDAKDVLLAGLQNSDAEIRRGCRRILGEVLELDFQQRKEKFLADKEGRQPHDLPAWQMFRDLVGDGPSARELFGLMLEQEAGLLESLETGSADAVKVRLYEVWHSMFGLYVKERKPASTATLATMLLAGSQSAVKLDESDNYWMNISSMLSQNDFPRRSKKVR